jgi:hypothetical protein
VQFEHLSVSRFGEFLSDFIELLPFLNRTIWDRICPRVKVLASSSIISFTVEVSKQNSLTITMPFDKTVLDLKHAISRQTGIPVTMQKLTFNENQLSDICLLSDYGIKAGSVIELAGEGGAKIGSAEPLKSKADSGPLQVSVRYQNNVMRMQAEPSATVAELKEMVAHQAGLPADSLWLILNGNMLKDEIRLESVGLRSSSVIVAGVKRRPTPDSGRPDEKSSSVILLVIEDDLDSGPMVHRNLSE